MEEQIVQLERLVNRLIDEEMTPIYAVIDELKTEIKAAHSLAKSEAEKVLSHTRAEIAQLALRLDRAQVLDLRWAIVGLFVSAIGTLLQYWA